MPARVVMVHDEPAFADQFTSALELAGHVVAAFADPIEAWDILGHPRQIEVLVTRLEFPPGRSNGIALAARVRASRPETRVLIIGPPEYAKEVDGLGTYVETPVIVQNVVEAVLRFLEKDGVHFGRSDGTLLRRNRHAKTRA